MLAVENSTDPSLVGQRPAERNDVHLMRDAVRGTAMSRAERQAGAYKVEIKNGPAPPTRAVRGGWLCDEVGMGKTAVVTSLVLANRSSATRVPDAAFKKAMTRRRRRAGRLPDLAHRDQ